MTNLTFKEFCYRVCDGMYDPNFPEESQSSGYYQLKKMVSENITPASLEEIVEWENNVDYMFTIPDIKYLRFLHPILRPYIVEHWDKIKTFKIDESE